MVGSPQRQVTRGSRDLVRCGIDGRKKYEARENLTTLPVSVIMLDVIKNTPAALKPFAPFVEDSLPTLRSGQKIEIDSTGKVTVIAPGR